MIEKMNLENERDEIDVEDLKMAIKDSLIGDAKITMKVYALLEVAISICGDVEFIEEAFSEVINRRGN